MFPVISFAGLTLPVGPLAFIIAFYVGVELGVRAIGRAAPVSQQKEWQSAFNNAAFIALLAGLVGARLGYAARFYSLYAESPLLLLSLRPGTLALLPGLLAAGAAGLFTLHRKNISLAHIADAVAVGLAGALVILNLGRFLTGEGYGLSTEAPWGVDLWGVVRHPVQLYEAVALLVILIVLWRIQPRSLPGELFWRFVMLYSLSVLFLDAFHASGPTWSLGIRVPQVIALAGLLVALYILSFYARQRQQHDIGPGPVRHHDQYQMSR